MKKPKRNLTIALIALVTTFLGFIVLFIAIPQIIFPQQGQIVCSGSQTIGLLSCSVDTRGGEPTIGDQYTSGGTLTFTVSDAYDLWGRGFDSMFKPVLSRDDLDAKEFFTDNSLCKFDGSAKYNTDSLKSQGCNYFQQCPQFSAYSERFQNSILKISSDTPSDEDCKGIVDQFDTSSAIYFSMNPGEIANRVFQHQLMIMNGNVESIDGQFESQNFTTYGFCDFGNGQNICVIKEPTLPEPCTDNSDCGWRGSITNIKVYLKVNGHTQDDVCIIGGICDDVNPPNPNRLWVYLVAIVLLISIIFVIYKLVKA